MDFETPEPLLFRRFGIFGLADFGFQDPDASIFRDIRISTVRDLANSAFLYFELLTLRGLEMSGYWPFREYGVSIVRGFAMSIFRYMRFAYFRFLDFDISGFLDFDASRFRVPTFRDFDLFEIIRPPARLALPGIWAVFTHD